MRLSWQEIRNRSVAFSDTWKDAHYEMGETQGFYIDFFKVFGIDYRRVLRFEEKVELIEQGKRGRIDAFWPGMLLVEQKSEGRDLARAKTQAFDYFEGLRDRDLPKFVLTCDFQTFELHDLKERETHRFKLADLHKHVEAFGFMLGVERRYYGEQDEVSIKAAELLGKVHDALEAKKYRGVELEKLMVRLLFLLFADDTGIFDDKDDFRFLIEENADEDGGNIGRILNHLFEVLDTPIDERVTGLDPEFAKFPYVNGDLFKGHVRTAPFDAQMRDDLLECCAFDWGAVSPAIFGSLFQSVMDKAERRKKGAHYTTEPNIRKVIGPLFLDELREELDRLKAHRGTQKRAQLLQFQEKLAGLNFFDPACGCGNFLVVTYRELRRLEQEALEQIYTSGQLGMFEVESLSMVKLSQFYGIELEEFPAHIAEVAMWMTEHLANIELGRSFGKVFADIPLRDGAHIHHGDALAIDWDAVLPHEQCFAVMGNPPFVGAKFQSAEQRQQVRELARLGGSGGTLDFVAAWFIKAGAYLQSSPARGGGARRATEGYSPSSDDVAIAARDTPPPSGKPDGPPPLPGEDHATRIGFVATNSITQGEQVAQLWPILFERYGLEIAFAHRTFAWGSDARGKAHVHVVIIGLVHRDHQPKEKRLFSYDDINGEPDETRHGALTAYLFDAGNVANRHLVVSSAARPLSATDELRYGSQPIDGGHLIFDADERDRLREKQSPIFAFLRPFVGSVEYINGQVRWIAAFQSAAPVELNKPEIRELLAQVRAFRRQSKRPVTQQLANFPTQFAFTTIPEANFLVIPEVSSERRDYVPIGWLEPPTIPSNLVRVLDDATLFAFSVLTSQMHMAWLRHIGGRLKSDYRYSNRLVYNTFPWPDATAEQRARIEALAQDVLDARAAWPTSSLADLYDPDTMPANLRKAHHALDLAVDRLYRRQPFATDRDRVEHLFGRYEALVAPMEHEAARQNQRVARRAKQQTKADAATAGE